MGSGDRGTRLQKGANRGQKGRVLAHTQPTCWLVGGGRPVICVVCGGGTGRDVPYVLCVDNTQYTRA